MNVKNAKLHFLSGDSFEWGCVVFYGFANRSIVQ